MSKILPVLENPPIKSYNYVAQPLSILYGNVNDPDCYIMDRFIQLHSAMFCSNNEVDNKIAFYTPVFALWEPFETEIYEEEDFEERGILEQLKKELDSNHYIYIFINDFYIPFASRFQKQNYAHDFLFYGYDDDKKEIFTMCYSNNGKYCKQKLPYDVVLKAYETRGQTPYAYIQISCKPNFDTRMCISKNPLIKRLLGDYIGSKNSFDWFAGDGKPAFGMATYSRIHSFVECSLEEFDMRMFTVLLEHKTLMHERILNYLHFSELGNEYEAVKKLAVNTEFIALKFNKKKSKSSRQNIHKNLNKMEELEFDILSRVYFALDSIN